MQLKRLKPLLPPIALPLARSIAARFGHNPEWRYEPRGWLDNDPRGMGWLHPSVIEAQRRRWPDFVSAVQSNGPLGISHEAARFQSSDALAHNAQLTFAYVLARAAAGKKALSVLDWGGGLGYHAVIAQAVLPGTDFDYTVEEVPDACRDGSALLPDVRFTSGGEVCFSRRYDLVLASNSLQYCRDWRTLVARLASSAKAWVFLTRLPLVEQTASFAVVQRPHSVGYRTEYISWVFNRHEVLSEAESAHLMLEREFVLSDTQPRIAQAPESHRDWGFLFRRVSR